MIQFRQRCFTFMFPFLYFVDTLSHFLRKAHIGEVQVSIWDDATVKGCEEAGIPLL